jgi:hypothetical protein
MHRRWQPDTLAKAVKSQTPTERSDKGPQGKARVVACVAKRSRRELTRPGLSILAPRLLLLLAGPLLARLLTRLLTRVGSAVRDSGSDRSFGLSCLASTEVARS